MVIINQNIKLILIILIIAGSNFVYRITKPEKKIVDLKKQIIYNVNYDEKTGEMSKIKDEKVDINLAKLKDFIEYGLNATISKKILTYREIVGKVTSIDDLIRIEGIGKKSVEKISEKAEVRETAMNMTRNIININKANSQQLLYYGFSKSERAKIESYIKKHGVIYSNVEMLRILGEERYREYEEVLSY